jgi:hypothetical protein
MNTETYLKTDDLLDSVERMRRAIININKARKTWKKYKAAAAERGFTEEQLQRAQQVCQKAVEDGLADLIFNGMYVSQLDEDEIALVADEKSRQIITR